MLTINNFQEKLKGKIELMSDVEKDVYNGLVFFVEAFGYRYDDDAETSLLLLEKWLDTLPPEPEQKKTFSTKSANIFESENLNRIAKLVVLQRVDNIKYITNRYIVKECGKVGLMAKDFQIILEEMQKKGIVSKDWKPEGKNKGGAPKKNN